MGQGYAGSYESGGVGDMVDLTTEVQGTLPVANGGTGATTLADNSVLTGTGTAAITAEANLLFTGSLLTVLDGSTAVIGHTAAVITGATNTFQVLGTAAADTRGTFGRFSADADGPSLDFLKSRNATIASNTIVTNSDVVGRVAWHPADGTDFGTLAAVFQGVVDDATPAVGDVGMAFVWRAMRGGATALVDVMRLSAGGALSPGVSDATALGTGTLMWSDLFLALGGVVNFNNGDVTVTHSANLLAFAGATSGYTFDVPIAVASGGTGAATLADNSVLTGTGTAAITAESNLLFTGQLLTSTTTTDAASVQVAIFQGDRATMLDNDEAYVTLRLSDDAGTQTEVARVTWVATDVNAATSVDGRLDFSVMTAGVLAKELQLDGLTLSPSTSDGLALGTGSLMWGDLFLALGAVVNFNNGDVLLTHSANTLAFSGASSGYTFDAVVQPSANDAAALGAATVSWSDLFLALGSVINWNNGDVLLTHVANALSFTGATGYSFDAFISPTNSDGAALGSGTIMWSDLFLALGAVVNFNNGDVTVTHSANLLAFAGATSGYTFDVPIAVASGGTGAATFTDNSVLTGTGTAALTAEANLTFTGQLLTSTTTTDAASVQVAILQGDRATMVDNDEAYVTLRLSDDAGTQTEVARVTWVATDVNVATSVDGRLDFSVMTAGVLAKELQLDGLTLSPSTSDGLALGTGSLMWGDLFLASGGVINFNNGDVLMTHSANTLAFTGASSGYTFDAVVQPSANDAAALGAATVSWSDLFLALGSVINWNNGDVLLTHVANALSFTGAAGYSFDAFISPTNNDGAALGSGTITWSDLFLALGGVINFNNGDVTVTHSANNLAFDGSVGATLGYSFDNNVIVGVATAGATAQDTLCLSNTATAPTTSVDRTHLYSADAAAGAATLALWQEEVPGVDVIANSTHSIRVSLNGVFYKVHLSSV